ncbi:hypothetical protein L227DRAFT_650200 [Lentinus tigrinus ALCF2SS1-6]|uniref:RING-type domain-containing protein n=1 Tax=Lentinus tigrinus ALCF2SS1-6 TaxID=1328759 RepID=A0A5C2SML6_9APHY|nr:hypothetical protein L227DRAFT_650200 [Lentinus tigrinus ALCF2SS1-6]
MSSREPLWYCHECHAEMRPLMVPDPHCASCNGTFVEKIENPADDPREFQVAEGGQWDDGPLPGDMGPFLAGLRTILGGVPPTPSATQTASTGEPSSGTQARRTTSEGATTSNPTQVHTTGGNSAFTIRIERSSTPGGQTRTFVYGNSPRARDSADGVPRLSDFAPPRNVDGTQQGSPNITGPLLAQYLLTLMGPGRGGDPFAELLGGVFGPGATPGAGGSEPGRWGDYVFNQEALDQIISQIMENSNAHQPVPATEEVIEKLPREVLEQGSPLLEKDCAVCKDQFALGTEDPDEQVVITLPCQHPFHEPCILPWLKTSGTCPVCRYQLVPQPGSQAPGSGPPPSGSNRSTSSPSGGAGGSGGATGILSNVLHLFSGHHGSGASSSSAAGSGGSGSGSTAANQAPQQESNTAASTQQSSSQRDPPHDFPGGWADQVD